MADITKMEYIDIACPECTSKNVNFNEIRKSYVCIDCYHEFTIKKISHRRIFLSYGHDEYAAVAEQLKKDLKERGHEVWFDLDRLKPGGDWETYIEEGLEWVSEVPDEGCFILLMTPHSVRRPGGYCLNELARAFERNLTIIPVMVVWSEPPLSICRIQWLDMRDCVPLQDRREQYLAKFERLIEALEQDRIDFEGVHARLKQRLQPLEFDADIIRHLTRFTGRQWVFDQIDEWLEDAHQPRVFWITGNPGVGKTAIAVWLFTHYREVAAFHLCQHGHKDKSNPRKTILSIAYQLSSQLPDYQERLNGLNLEEIVTQENAKTLFDNLIVQPLSSNFPHPGRTIIILIDALDEATEGDKNEIASFIASEFDNTPEWIRLIITSRPEPEVTYILQALTPYILNASSPENEKDLRAFLRRELVPFADGKDVPSFVIDTIISNSEGIFLYVEWIRRELEQGRLSLDRLDEFPQGLGGIYTQFFKRQFPDSNIFKSKYRPVLEIMAAACEPLELDYISSIFNWLDYEQGEIMDAFGSLFPISANRIHPFHKSVLDWLTDRGKAGPYFTRPQKGHKHLADYGWLEYKSGAGSMSKYFIIFLPTHLSKIGRREDLHKLLLDFDWIQAKLDATDVNSLITDYDFLPEDRQLRLVQGAIRLSSTALAWDKTELVGQLFGRLQSFRESEIQSMLKQARGWKSGLWLYPLTASLTPPGPLMRTLDRHTSEVYAVAVTPDSRFAVSTSSDTTMRIWDIESGVELRTLEDGSDYFTAVAVTPDGRFVVSASQDGILKVWDIESGEKLRTLTGHTDPVEAVAVTPNGRFAVSASADETLKVWNIENGDDLHTLTGHTGWVVAVAVTPNGHFAVSASWDKTLKVWDIESGEELRTLRGHTDPVEAVAVTPDGKHAISGSRDNTLKVWDIESGEELRTLKDHIDFVVAVAVTPDGRFAVSASWDKTLKVWDIKSEEEINALKGHTKRVSAVDVTPDGRFAVSASWDHTLKVWDIESGEELQRLVGYTDMFTGVAITPDGKHVILGSGAKNLMVWDFKSGEILRPHTSWVKAVAVTPDGKHAISASSDSTLNIWDIESGEKLQTLKGGITPVMAVALVPDGRFAASASRNRILKVWDLESSEELQTLIGHVDRHVDQDTAIAITPDGRFAVSGSWNNTLNVWDIESEKLRKLTSHTTDRVWSINAVDVAPDGSFAVSASDDHTLKVWNLESGEVIACFSGDNSLMSCAVSTDGVTIVAGEISGRVHFLRLEGVQ